MDGRFVIYSPPSRSVLFCDAQSEVATCTDWLEVCVHTCVSLLQDAWGARGI